jgi:predicted O-methyltransferase YrrM
VSGGAAQARWTAVDDYFASKLVAPDAVLEAVLAANTAAGLAPENVSPNQGQLLQILARAVAARSILEIGTHGGYSTIWLARALPPGGRLVTLEVDATRAELARANVARAGLASVVDVRCGGALETLPRLAAEGREPFDLVFIDADKRHNPEYFRWALQLSRVGALIVVDNVVRAGAVVDTASDDPSVQGVRRLADVLAAERRVSAGAVQTVGSKGYDGMIVALVTAPAPIGGSP